MHPMNTLRRFSRAIMAPALALALSACGSHNPKSGTPVAPVPVKVEQISGQKYRDVLHATGTVRAIEDVMISPEEGGVVREWVIKKGHRVTKGVVIARLKDDVLK